MLLAGFWLAACQPGQGGDAETIPRHALAPADADPVTVAEPGTPFHHSDIVVVQDRDALDCPAGSHEVQTASGQECVDERGEREGPSVSYYVDGRVHARGSWRAGERDGPWAMWEEDGSPSARGEYEAGAKVGTWQRWDNGGAAMREVIYANGNKLSEGPLLPVPLRFRPTT